MPERLDVDLRTGAKAAAAAAAVGAAVGAARAIAARAEEAAQHDEDHDEPAVEGDEPEPEVQDVQEVQEEREREPVRGLGADRLQRLAAQAREILETLSGADVESVSGFECLDGGWRVTVEAVEVRRIPESTDVLATYDVELDDDGDLVRYERRRRYARAQSDHGDGR